MHALPPPAFDHRQQTTPHRLALIVVGGAASLAISTLATFAVERLFGVHSAAPIYQLAVVAMALAFGTRAAVPTAIAAFLIYDVLFIAPVYTVTIADPAEWLNLVLLLVVGVVVGRLAGLEYERAGLAMRREREARALFGVGRLFAERREMPETLHAAAALLVDELGLSRVWIGLGHAGEPEQIAADTGSGPFPPPAAPHRLLRRSLPDGHDEWAPEEPADAEAAPIDAAAREAANAEAVYRVRIEADGQALGSIWATRAGSSEMPSAEETRVLTTVADQVGQAIERDRLAAEALNAQVLREGDALKTALLDSVSHDLRTPLASIRAAAGSLMDPQLQWAPHEQRGLAAAIDREADRLSRLVTNMLDMSRIEGGALVVDLEPFPIRDVVLDAVDRRRALLKSRPVAVEVRDDLPFVLMDGLLMEQVLANIIENAALHTPDGTRIRVRAAALPGDGRVRLTIEDAGPGVPPEALPRLFEKFFRVPKERESARKGTGVGLAVVRGLCDLMGATIVARPSELGGLAFDIDLQTAPQTIDDSDELERPSAADVLEPAPSAPKEDEQVVPAAGSGIE